MDLLLILRHLPLISASGWFVLVAFQIYRDRMRTWTETFFLFSSFFAAMYGFADWLFFNARSDAAARFAALVSLTSLTMAQVFFLLFTLVYVGQMKRRYWSFVAVAGVILIMIWGVMLEGVVAPSGEGLYLPVFNPMAFDVFLAYILATGVLSVWNLYRLYQIVRTQRATLSRRVSGLTIAFTMVLVLGLATNGYLGATRNKEIPPPFSTLLLMVLAVAAYTLYPGTRERISEVVRRFKARRYELKKAFLIYQDGTLIQAKSETVEGALDEDLFTATLDVIQNFMRTSFPFLKGTSLRTIEHGSYRILIERGRWCYLTVVLSGEENDLLRRQMRDLLLQFENENAVALQRWRGIPADAPGADGLLRSLFEPADLFGPPSSQ